MNNWKVLDPKKYYYCNPFHLLRIKVVSKRVQSINRDTTAKLLSYMNILKTIWIYERLHILFEYMEDSMSQVWTDKTKNVISCNSADKEADD